MKKNIILIWGLVFPLFLFGFNPKEKQNLIENNLKVDTVIFPINTGDPVEIKGGDLYASSLGTSFILVDPNGGCWESKVDASGIISMDSIPCPGGTIPVDGDGNIYGKVNIGNQVWLDKSLHTNSYNDGSPITYLSSFNAIENAINPATLTPGFSDWNFDQSNGEIRGSFYNYLVTDPLLNGNKNVCPVGYKIPSDADFLELITFLDPSGTTTTNTAAGYLKSSDLWLNPNLLLSPTTGMELKPGSYLGYFLGWNAGSLLLWSSSKDTSASPIVRSGFYAQNNSLSLIQFGVNDITNELRKIRCIQE